MADKAVRSPAFCLLFPISPFIGRQAFYRVAFIGRQAFYRVAFIGEAISNFFSSRYNR